MPYDDDGTGPLTVRRQIVALAAAQLKVTLPPDGGNAGGLTPMVAATRGGGSTFGANVIKKRPLEFLAPLRATSSNATVRGTVLGLAPIVTRAENVDVHGLMLLA